IRWCNRRAGIGADGVLVITRLSSERVSMRYWNADGGEAEMCGNGLRCIARLAFDRGWVDAPGFTVESAVGDHPVHVKDDSVTAFVGEPSPFRSRTLSIAGHEIHPFAIGNPHAVLFVDDVDDTPVTELGPTIENDPLFPNRTNVEFVQVLEDGGIRARVWERGVGETEASGTGATASAYIAHTIREVPLPVKVSLPGGALTVWFDEEGAWMNGPTEYAFEGSVD
ncbi:MAG: diaminopimelate epimerase, partial [Actinomycetota bacterium]